MQDDLVQRIAAHPRYRIAFVAIWLFSMLDRGARAKKDRAGFLSQQVRSETGIGAALASGH